jgi:phosphatidate cytidylyltransferase
MVRLWAVVKTNALATRIGSALVMAPAWVAVVWMGGKLFLAAIALGAVLALREWIRMVARADGRPPRFVSYGLILVILGMLSLTGPLPALILAFGLSPLPGLAAAGVRGIDRWWLHVGVPYIAGGALSMVWLREQPGTGLVLILFLCATVWATDTGAYIFGSWIGGPKLAPGISPRKTWAGLIGGVFSAALAGGGVAIVAGGAEPILAAGVGILLALADQTGDLFESAAKRRYQLKDSGALIPGHGGLLDRIDGLILASPVLALFHATAGAFLPWWSA